MPNTSALIGRFLIAALFVISGIDKLIDPAGYQAQVAHVGMLAGLAKPIGLFEVVAGLSLGAGVLTRMMVVVLSAFTLATIALVHNHFADPLQLAMALKNLAVLGGLLLVFAHSRMWWEYSALRRKRASAALELDADDMVHDGEMLTA